MVWGKYKEAQEQGQERRNKWVLLTPRNRGRREEQKKGVKEEKCTDPLLLPQLALLDSSLGSPGLPQHVVHLGGGRKGVGCVWYGGADPGEGVKERECGQKRCLVDN